MFGTSLSIFLKKKEEVWLMLFFIKICNLVNIFSKNEKETWKKDFYEIFFTIFKKKI